MTASDEIKARLNLADVVEESHPLIRRGRYARGKDNDSLIVDVQRNVYFWNSQSEHGSVFDWWMNRNGWDFMRALEEGARRANIPLQMSDEQRQRQAVTNLRRKVWSVAADVFQRWLMKDDEALAYVRGRGWTDETIEKAMLGFTGRMLEKDNPAAARYLEEMRAEFGMYGIDPESPQAVAVTGFRGVRGDKGAVEAWCERNHIDQREATQWVEWGLIPGMMGRRGLVYPHLLYGDVTYLSARNILGDDQDKDGHARKGNNLNRTLAGERQLYYGWNYQANSKEVIMIEGQGDAVTLAQAGFVPVANCGTGWQDHAEELKGLGERHGMYWAPDNDAAGKKSVKGASGDFPLAETVGAMCRIVAVPSLSWKDGKTKDFNDLRKKFLEDGMSEEEQAQEFQAMLDVAEPLAIVAAQHAASLRGSNREKAMGRAFEIIAKMDTKSVAIMMSQLVKATGMGVRDFQRLLKATKGEQDKDDDKPAEVKELIGGSVRDANGDVWLLEYLFDPKELNARLAWRNPKGEITSGNYVEIDGIRYQPAPPSMIVQNGGVIFPSAVGQLKTTRELVQIIELFISRYFLLDNPLNYKLAAYYVLLTWVYDCFGALPYLRARGGPGTGKSEMMLRIGHVCYRTTILAGASTTASMKQAMDKYRGTVFMDEMDTSDKYDERLVILNVGAMKKQALIWSMTEAARPDGTKFYDERAHNVYGPKLITMYKKFHDDATESRCLTFELPQKEAIEIKRKGIPFHMPKDFFEQAGEIRNMLLAWRMKWWRKDEVELGDAQMDFNVSPRLNQVTMPLKYIAQDDPAMLQDIHMFVRSLNDQLILERSMTKEARVLDAILAISEDNKYVQFLKDGRVNGYGDQKYVFARDIAEVANNIMDEMNASDSANEDEDEKKKRRKGITTQTASSICRLDFQMQAHRMGNGFVILLDPERITALKIKYGLAKANADGKVVPARESEEERFAAQADLL